MDPDDPYEKAAALQNAVRDSEGYQPQHYKPDQVRRAVVHTREDLVLVVSYLGSTLELLGSIKKLLGSIKRLLVVIAVAAVVSAVVLVWG